MNNQQFKLVGATRDLMCLLAVVLGMFARSPIVVAQEIKSISEYEILPANRQAQLLQTDEVKLLPSR